MLWLKAWWGGWGSETRLNPLQIGVITWRAHALPHSYTQHTQTRTNSCSSVISSSWRKGLFLSLGRSRGDIWPLRPLQPTSFCCQMNCSSLFYLTLKFSFYSVQESFFYTIQQMSSSNFSGPLYTRKSFHGLLSVSESLANCSVPWPIFFRFLLWFYDWFCALQKTFN